MGCAQICNVLHGSKPVFLMVAYQVMIAGLTILFKLLANDGMSLTVFTAYRLLFASVFVIPLALLVERNKRPKMTWGVLVQAFFCGLLGIAMAQNLYVMSIALVSATYAAAISNVVPAITFVMAVCFRLEKLALRTIPGAAKVLGTAVAMGGAMLFTFYKGSTINLWSLHPHLMHTHNRLHSSVHVHGSSDQALGSVFAVVSCLGSSSWLIIQGKMSKTYPCPLSATALITLMATIQCLVFALCIERDWTQWKLGFNIRLLAVSYSGILASGIGIALAIWCVNMRGPLFVASFSPAMLVLVAIFGSLLLEEKLYLGSVLGAVLIICGLYLVLWGNCREMQRRNRVEPVFQTPRPSEARSIEIIETSPAIISENNNNIKRDGRRG